MTAATAENPAIKTGNVILDMELPLLTDKQLEKLADYAKFLIWLRDHNSNRQDNNDDGKK